MSEQNPNGAIGNVAGQARDAVSETARTVKNAAADAIDKTEDFARQAGNQATAAARSLYGQGNDLAGVLDRAIVENPYAAMLVAGVLGFGIAMATRRR